MRIRPHLIFRKRGDTSPWPFEVLDGDLPFDLTGWTLTLFMRAIGETVNKIANSAVTLTDAPGGEIEYEPVLADVDTADEYETEIKAVDAEGVVHVLPQSDGVRIRVHITESLLPE